MGPRVDRRQTCGSCLLGPGSASQWHDTGPHAVLRVPGSFGPLFSNRQIWSCWAIFLVQM